MIRSKKNLRNKHHLQRQTMGHHYKMKNLMNLSM